MKVALIHDWLVTQRGGEQVLLELARLFPFAPIYTLVHQRGSVHPDIESHPIHTSFIQRLPGAPLRFRHYLPLFPRAIEAFDLRQFDLIVSSSHCVAKAVKTTPAQRHVAYIHTPMRYLWEQRGHYYPALLPAPAVDWLTEPLRRWDVMSSARPDQLLANSQYIAGRIKQTWLRHADVLHPPVDVDFFAQTCPTQKREGYVIAGALVGYKRVDLAVRTATRNSSSLTVVGDGPELRRLKQLAGPSVRFTGNIGRAQLREAFRCAKALLICAEEDFGITPLEAQAAGCPIIALSRGGSLETVIDECVNATGVFFSRPDESSLHDAMARFEARLSTGEFSRETLLTHASRFSRQLFAQKMTEVVAGK